MSTLLTYDPRIEDLVGAVREREAKWSGHLQRREIISDLAAGRWDRVFPDDVSDEDLPMVANIFRTTIEDVGRLFAEQSGTERVDPAGERDVRKAEVRERAIGAYSNISRFWDNAEFYGQDMVAVGFTAIKTWPDMSAPPERRFPIFERIDPRHILPEVSYRPSRPTDNVIVSYWDSVERIEDSYPEQVHTLLERIASEKSQARMMSGFAGTYSNEPESPMPSHLRVVDWYSCDRVVRSVLYDGNQDSSGTVGRSDGVVLVDIENPTDLCPVQIAYRPTWAQEPYGQLDDARGIVRAQNRYFRMLLDYFVDMVYGGKLTWNVKNPGDKGPGVRYYALGPDARMESITPDMPAPIAMAVLQQLDQEARSTSVAPRSREGDVQLNKASAAFLDRAQGQLKSVVASLQRSFAQTKQRSNEVAMAMDVAWCDSTKEVTGRARGRRFRMTYKPSRDIGEDFSNVVTYGLRAGYDAATWNIIQLQKQGAGNISRESFLEEDPSIDDVENELNRLRAQALEDSLMAGLLQADIGTRIEAILAFKDESDIINVAQRLQAAQAAAQAAAGPPGLGGPPTGAGLPPAQGGGGAAPPAGASGAPTPLPPLAELRQLGR